MLVDTFVWNIKSVVIIFILVTWMEFKPESPFIVCVCMKQSECVVCQEISCTIKICTLDSQTTRAQLPDTTNTDTNV